jgi:DNA-binding CsgD family transcriptional regulator
MNSMRLRTQMILASQTGTMDRSGPPLRTSPIIGPEGQALRVPDGDLVAAVIHVHERVRARLRALREGGHASSGLADPHAWDDAPGVLRRLGLQERFTAPVPSGRPLVTDAGDRAMPVDEVIDIALACLAALAASGAADAADWAGPAASGPILTTREQEVVRLVAEGLSNKGIAQALHITRHTVKRHIASAMNRLGAANRAHAAVLATQRRLL